MNTVFVLILYLKGFMFICNIKIHSFLTDCHILFKHLPFCSVKIRKVHLNFCSLDCIVETSASTSTELKQRSAVCHGPIS